jgi:hypothetical protein
LLLGLALEVVMSEPADPNASRPWFLARTRYGEEDPESKGKPWGRPRKFASPDDLRNACAEYFAWIEANPLYSTEAKSTKDGVELVDLPRMRAMTILGLCNFLDIDQGTWAAYKLRR